MTNTDWRRSASGGGICYGSNTQPPIDFLTFARATCSATEMVAPWDSLEYAMISRSACGILSSLILMFASTAQAALLPPHFLDAVVALGAVRNTAPPGEQPRVEWFTEGTGFFYGKLVKDDQDVTKRLYQIYLVTAAHVVHDHLSALGPIHIRVNPKHNAGQELDLPLSRTANWFSRPNVDVAVVPIDFSVLKDTQTGFFESDVAAATVEKLKKDGIAAGDGAYVLGFPMNLAGAQRNYVIVRNGIIARLSELFDNASSTYLIDSFVFPGNSGGPVVLKPEAATIHGTQPQLNARLIGMVIEYQSYIDTAVSSQTHRPRVVFEENSGLAEVLPVDAIDATIKASPMRPSQAVPAKH